MIVFDLFELGDVEIDLNFVTKKLRSRSFSSKTNFPVKTVDPTLFKSIDAAHPSVPDIIRVGITVAPIPSGALVADNGNDAIVIGLGSDARALSREAGRTIEEYVVCRVLTQFLAMEYAKHTPGSPSLFHSDARECIFNSGPQEVAGLKTCKIHSKCKAELEAASINPQWVEDAEQILKKIATPSFAKTLQLGLRRNVIFSLLFGGVVVAFVVQLVFSFLLGQVDPATGILLTAIIAILGSVLLLRNYIQQGGSIEGLQKGFALLSALTLTLVVVIITTLLVKALFIDPETFSIESVPLHAFNYAKPHEANVGDSSTYFSFTRGKDAVMSYDFSYSLPETGDGWGGLAFQFLQPQDLHTYNYITLLVSSSNQGVGQLYFVDDENNREYYIFTDSISISEQEQEVKIPISKFGGIKFGKITEMGFSVWVGFTKGSHDLKVKEIKLTKN